LFVDAFALAHYMYTVCVHAIFILWNLFAMATNGDEDRGVGIIEGFRAKRAYIAFRADFYFLHD